MKVFGARVAPVWFAGVLVSVVALAVSGCGGEPMSAVPPAPGGPAASDVAVACKNGGVCKVGDMGPGGGVVFYADDPNLTWGQYLEAAPGNWHGEDPTAFWGCPGMNIPGALGQGIGQGLDNTNAIIAECGTAGIAARWARYYNGGGKTDWYLPSLNELAHLAQQKDVVGGLDRIGPYWSSTQNDILDAWGYWLSKNQLGTEGEEPLDRLVDQGTVRPVRAFKPAGVPGAPAAPALAGAGSAGLSWAAPADGGMPIVGYNVQYSTSAGGEYSDAQGCTGLRAVLTCTATGLSSNTPYFFKVRAKNALGAGGYSGAGGPNYPLGSCALGGICRTGDTGPGGGTVFYVAGSPQPWGRYLEAAPRGWRGGGIDVVAPWGCAGTAISGAGGTGVGSGAANTGAISAGCADSGTAAKDAGGYRGGGKADWFLPSKDELNELFKHRDQVSGLTVGDYWSSSQSNKYTSDFQNLERGDQYVSGKASGKSVRAVRAFSPTVPTP